MEESFNVEYNRFLKTPRYPVKFAFSCKDVPYFEFESVNNMPILRYNAWKDIELMIQNGVDQSYLHAFCAAGIEAINNGRLNELGKLFENLEERISHITNIDLLYQMAAVFYFSYNEDPNKPDDQRNMEKIEAWKKEDIDDFFLKTRFYPSGLRLNSTISSMKDYMLHQRQVVLASSKHLLSKLSGMQGKNDLARTLRSQVESYENLIQSQH